MVDLRDQKLAQILVDYSARVKPGDRVAIDATSNAEPLVREIYTLTLQRGGHAHLMLRLPDQNKLFYANAGDAQLDFPPTFLKMVADQFDDYITVAADVDTTALRDVAPERQVRREKAVESIYDRIMERGAEGSLRWILTQYPTEAYARDAGMSLPEYADFLYGACHADEQTADPVAYWLGVQEKQQVAVQRLDGHDQVRLLGPNVDLSLSIKGRRFVTACGDHNLPDGEIFTGPVEDSVNGWIKYTYPAVHQGRMVEGIRLVFEKGRVVEASAEKEEAFLLKMIDADAGARYLGEFAIGTNYGIDRFTRNILFDEKLGGTVHLALGAGYPETGSVNNSSIHWDMICDMRSGSEIQVDGETIYCDGQFTF